MARASKTAKAESAARIVGAAARLFRERGLAATSVGDVMEEAGLTHGGFYRHFASKEALAEAAIDHAVEQSLHKVEAELQNGSVGAVRDYVELYLSNEHVATPAIGCPLAALSRDAALAGGDVGAAYSRGVERTLRILMSAMTGTPASRRSRAVTLLSMLIGAVSLARCVGTNERAAILRAARQAAVRSVTEAR